MWAGMSQSAVAIVRQPMAPVGVDGVQVGEVIGHTADLITVTPMAAIMALQQWLTFSPLNRWFWLLSLNPQFGITAQAVASIFLTRRIAQRVGRFNLQCHPVAK